MEHSKTWWSQALHNKMIALILAMIVIVPLIATPANSSLHGAAALAFEGLAILVFAVLMWRTQWTLRKDSIVSFLKTGVNLPLLLFLLAAVVSAVVAPFKQYSMQELLRIVAGILLYFAVAYQFRRSEYLTKLVDTLIFVAIGGALLGFAQYNSSQVEHATGVFGDHQLFGSFLMILLPLIGVVALTERNPNRQLVAQVATVLTGTALLLSQARSAWLGAAVGLAVLAVLTIAVAQRGHDTVRKYQVVLPLMLLAVSVGFFLLIWPQSSHIVGRATSLSNTQNISTWQIRQHTWTGALKMIQERPLTGFGLGQYAVFQKGYTHTGIPLDRIGGAASLGEQAHNWYLQTAAEMGIPALLLMVGVLVMFFVNGIRRAMQLDTGIRRNLLLGSLASVAAFAVDAFASPSWQCGQVSMFLWVSLGIGAACMRPQPRKREEPEAVPVYSMRFTRPVAVMASLGLALLLPSVVLAVGNLYATPSSATIRPQNATIRGGHAISYTLLVTYTDGTTRDVTNDSGSGPGSTNTVFTQAGGSGTISGNTYQSLSGESDTPTITGTYTQTADPAFPTQISGSVSASTKLLVKP